MFGYGFFNGQVQDWSSKNQIPTRALGELQWLGGNAQALGAAALATTCETGVGCVAAGYLFTTGVDNAVAGWQTLSNGAATPTWGGQVLQGLGMSPGAAELTYGLTQGGAGLATAIESGVKSILSTVGKGAASDIAPQGGLNLFKWGQETTTTANGWISGDYMLNLPNQGSPAANWAQNSSWLRKEMSNGNPIFDSYRDPVTGAQIPTGGFLNAERSLLENHGWQYNSQLGAYLPPGH
jgi:hypothetical protein